MRTDHKPLVSIFSAKGLGRASARIDRWISKLLPYNFDCKYRTGSENVVADFLSRYPYNECGQAQNEDDQVLIAAICSKLKAISPKELKDVATKCEEYSKLKDMITQNWPNKCSDEPDMKIFYRCHDELSVVNNLIMKGSHRIVVPRDLRQQILNLAHEQHQGIVQTKQRLRELYWWPGMDRDVEDLVKSCVACQECDKSAYTRPGPLQPIPLPLNSWKKVGIDILGPFELVNGTYRYAITVVDLYSKWPEVMFTSKTTTEIIITFLKTLFSREGNCEEIISDNGPQFKSWKFEEYLEAENIRHLKTALYHPQTNGEVERFNGTLKNAIQLAIIEGRDISESITRFLHVYRSTPHAATGVSPAELLHGRKMRTNLEKNVGQEQSRTSYNIRDKIGRYQEKTKLYFDQAKGAKERSFKKGQMVRVKYPRHRYKGLPHFSRRGVIQKSIGPNTFELEGEKWNIKHLSECAGGKNEECAELPTLPDTDPLVEQQDNHTLEQQPSVKRWAFPLRSKKRPGYLNDYLTD